MTPSIRSTDLRARARTRAGVLLCCAALAATSVGLATAPAASASPSTVPECPASAGNAAFVRYIYLAILNRCPDAGGLATYTAKLDDHSLSLAQFTDAIDMSKENVETNNVKDLYSNVLRRQPTAAELKAGDASIRGTHGDSNLIATLISSPELYATLPGSTTAKDTAYLNALLQNILDRSNTATLDSYYGRLLHTPSTRDNRYRVAMYMEHSSENAFSWVTAIYGATTTRVPTAAEIKYWMGWLEGPRGHWRTFRLFTLFLAAPGSYNFAQTLPNPPAEAQRLPKLPAL